MKKMIIAVMSDSHDNIWNLRNALDIVQKEKAEMIIHCGDFIAPFMLKELDQAGVPVHGVFGNNDGDRYLLTRFAFTVLKNITLYDPVGQLEIDGINIAFTHHVKRSVYSGSRVDRSPIYKLLTVTQFF